MSLSERIDEREQNQPASVGPQKSSFVCLKPLCHEGSAQPDAYAINQFRFMHTLQVTVPPQVTPETLGTAHLSKPCHSLSAVLVATGPRPGQSEAQLTTSNPGNAARPFASIIPSISCMASRRTNFIESPADSGNIWHRLYKCLLIRNTSQGPVTPGTKHAQKTPNLPHYRSPVKSPADCKCELKTPG